MQINLEPQQALSVINEAKNIALITSAPVSSDNVCALLSFYHTFKKFKRIRVVVPEEVPSSCHSLPESSVIEKDLGPKKFAINLDTNGVSLEKVSYLLEGKTFKLILHPQTRSFEAERVSYEYLGFPFDLFVFFGVKNLADVAPLFNYDLGEIYQNASLNFDISFDNGMFASINLIDVTSTSVCEMFFKMLGYWQINFEKDVSLCLLSGLVSSPLKESHYIFPDLNSKTEDGPPLPKADV